MNPPERPELSLVVPAYNEERRLPRALDAIEQFFKTRGLTAELVLVDDGSSDDTPNLIAQAVTRLAPLVQVSPRRHAVNRGKGAAVRTGCVVARGRYVIFIDADLAVPLAEADRLLEALRAGCEVAIGTRVQPDGKDMRASQPPMRRWGGKGFTWIRRRIAVPDIIDTQCPMKGFTHEAAQRVFHEQKLRGWAFDAELLFLARRARYRICQMPVVWQHVEGSKLRPSAKLVALAFWDLVRLRLVHLGGS
jgi:dolichyl-phosphate beta-glucosyltransferase